MKIWKLVGHLASTYVALGLGISIVAFGSGVPIMTALKSGFAVATGVACVVCLLVNVWYFFDSLV